MKRIYINIEIQNIDNIITEIHIKCKKTDRKPVLIFKINLKNVNEYKNRLEYNSYIDVKYLTNLYTNIKGESKSNVVLTNLHVMI